MHTFPLARCITAISLSIALFVPRIEAQTVTVSKVYAYELLRLCNEYNLSPYTVAKLIEWESRWDATRENENPNGTVDRGLMQLNSAYIPDFSKRYNGGARIDPLNWKVSMKVGIQHLAHLKEATGSEWGMVAAYNMGLTGYKKYRAGKRGLPTPTKRMVEFVFARGI